VGSLGPDIRAEMEDEIRAWVTELFEKRRDELKEKHSAAIEEEVDIRIQRFAAKICTQEMARSYVEDLVTTHIHTLADSMILAFVTDELRNKIEGMIQGFLDSNELEERIKARIESKAKATLTRDYTRQIDALAERALRKADNSKLQDEVHMLKVIRKEARRAIEKRLWRARVNKELAGGFVYVVRAGNLYKIGRARNVQMRMQAIQCGCPESIDLILTKETKFPAALECRFHEEFHDYRRNGEWFALEQEHIAWIEAFDVSTVSESYRVRLATGFWPGGPSAAPLIRTGDVSADAPGAVEHTGGE